VSRASVLLQAGYGFRDGLELDTIGFHLDLDTLAGLLRMCPRGSASMGFLVCSTHGWGVLQLGPGPQVLITSPQRRHST
jgi:hypothetical protein